MSCKNTGGKANHAARNDGSSGVATEEFMIPAWHSLENPTNLKVDGREICSAEEATSLLKSGKRLVYNGLDDSRYWVEAVSEDVGGRTLTFGKEGEEKRLFKRWYEEDYLVDNFVNGLYIPMGFDSENHLRPYRSPSNNPVIDSIPTYLPERSQHAPDLNLGNPSDFKKWMDDNKNQIEIGNVCVYRTGEDENVSGDGNSYVQISTFSEQTHGMYQSVLVTVQDAGDVEAVLSEIRSSGATSSILKNWELPSDKHLWEMGNSKSPIMNAKHGFDKEQYQSFEKFNKNYENGTDDYNYVLGWQWNEDRLKLRLHHQRMGITKSASIKVTPDNEPEVRKYLEGKKKYVLKSLSLVVGE